jgi:hypothetical protein
MYGNAATVLPTTWGSGTFNTLVSGNGTTDTNPQILTIVPNVTTAVLKRMAIIAEGYYGDNLSVTINSVKIGADPAITTFTPAAKATLVSFITNNPNCNVAEMLLPVKPGKNIEIIFQAKTARGYPSVTLAFEN